MKVKRTTVETYEIDDYKQLMVGDEIVLKDIESDNTIFQVAHIDNDYLYLMRKYLLPHKYDRPLKLFRDKYYIYDYYNSDEDLIVWLNNEYKNSFDCADCISTIRPPYITNLYPNEDHSLFPQWDIFKQGDLVKHTIEIVDDKPTEIAGNWWVMDNITPKCGIYYISSIGHFTNNEEEISIEKAGILPCLFISIH